MVQYMTTIRVVGVEGKEIQELTVVPRIMNFVKEQRIKWFKRVMMRWSNSENIKATVKWKSMAERMSKKRRVDGIRNYLKKLGVMGVLGRLSK